MEETITQCTNSDIDKTIKQIEEIDFSLILKESFYVTIDSNNKIHLKKGNYDFIMPNVSAKKEQTESDLSQDELNIFAGIIVTNASHIPRSLFCPFCANEYMFEFTLKDHLIRFHPVELEERLQCFKDSEDNDISDTNHVCPFCGAIFYLIGLIPKHIANFHGNRYLQRWRHMSGNLLRMVEEKENEPSILYASCSPGLSDIFDKLGTDEKQYHPDTLHESPQIKSILKKTPSKSSKIICSPSGVSIRRSKSEIIKRTLSVRRELRFDLPPLQKSPEQQVVRKYRKFLDLKKLFSNRKKSPKKSKKNKEMNSNMITSTPLSFLEEDIGKKPIWKKKNSQPTIRPLLFSSERYQCARCKSRYASNGDLVMHLKDLHTGVRNILKPHYQCGQCGVTFFRNSYLIRHCHFQHTPQKVRL